MGSTYSCTKFSSISKLKQIKWTFAGWIHLFELEFLLYKKIISKRKKTSNLYNK